MNFSLAVTLNDISNGSSEFLGPENLDQAFDITFLSHLGAEI